MATTYYVAKTGNDGNPGTIGSPKLTITAGVALLSGGDTLYIRAGIYAEDILDSIPSGTSWSDFTLVSNYNGETATLRPSSEWILHFQQIGGVSQHYIEINGLILDGTNISRECVKLTGPTGGTDITDSHHIRLRGCEIKNAPGQGVLEQHSHHNEYIDCHVHDNGQDLGSLGAVHALYLGGHDCLVDGCLIHDSHGYGIHIYDNLNPAEAYNFIVRNCTVYGEGFATHEAGIILSGINNVAYNNIVRDCYFGFVIRRDGNAVYNNTVVRNVGGISIEGTNLIHRNNIYHQNNTDVIVDGGTGTIASDNLTTDPLFISPVSNDFHLQAGSPAIGVGFDLSGTVTTDFDGNTRTVPYDIGAYKFGDSPGSPLAPNSGGILLGGFCSDVECYNNIVRDQVGNAGGIYTNLSNESLGTKVYNNTVVRNARAGIDISGSTNIVVRNNISRDNSHLGGGFKNIETAGGSVTTPTLSNNLVFGTGGTANGDIVSDPLFVNYAGNDFHLTSGSPAIDAGINVGLAFLGAAPDLGANEFGGTSFPPPDDNFPPNPPPDPPPTPDPNPDPNPPPGIPPPPTIPPPVTAPFLQIEYGGVVIATVPIELTVGGHYVKAMISALNPTSQVGHAWLVGEPSQAGAGSSSVNSEVDQILRVILRANRPTDILEDDFVQLRTAIALWLYQSGGAGGGGDSGIAVSFVEFQVPLTGIVISQAEFEVPAPFRLWVSQVEFEVPLTGLVVSMAELEVPDVSQITNNITVSNTFPLSVSRF
jgi:hypothetical protein